MDCDVKAAPRATRRLGGCGSRMRDLRDVWEAAALALVIGCQRYVEVALMHAPDPHLASARLERIYIEEAETIRTGNSPISAPSSLAVLTTSAALILAMDRRKAASRARVHSRLIRRGMPPV
jgi:hypothetical protein